MRFIALLLLAPLFGLGQDSLFTADQRPGTEWHENSLEVGSVIQFTKSGIISFIKFYAVSPQQYVANVWKGEEKVFSQSFTANEKGWQAVPCNYLVEPGEYTVSVYCPSGHYGSRNWVFSNEVVKGSLVFPAQSGKFIYATQSLKPNQSYRSRSYYVDIVFNEQSSITISAGKDTALVLSLDTCGFTPSVSFNLTATGPDNLTYHWREYGDTSFKKMGKVVPIVYNHMGTYLYEVVARNQAGETVASSSIFVRIDGNPKDVVIEILRDGTYRVVEKNAILLKDTWPVEREIP